MLHSSTESLYDLKTGVYTTLGRQSIYADIIQKQAHLKRAQVHRSHTVCFWEENERKLQTDLNVEGSCVCDDLKKVVTGQQFPND